MTDIENTLMTNRLKISTILNILSGIVVEPAFEVEREKLIEIRRELMKIEKNLLSSIAEMNKVND